MAQISVVRPGMAGAAPPDAVECSTTDDYVRNSPGLILEFTNGGEAAATVTFKGRPAWATNLTRTVTIPAGETRLVGGFPRASFGGNLHFSASSGAVTVRAYAR